MLHTQAARPLAEISADRPRDERFRLVELRQSINGIADMLHRCTRSFREREQF
jgi:hypothetical protein